MKKLFLAFLFGTKICTLQINSQNPLWSLPNNSYDIIPAALTPLPSFTPSQNGLYNGDPALFAHNSMPDETGNLRFFIVDGTVYDRDGYGLDFLTYNGVAIQGDGEFAIIPVPNNCNKYYIIGKGYNDNFSDNMEVICGVFTFEEFSPAFPNKRGRFEVIDQTNQSNIFSLKTHPNWFSINAYKNEQIGNVHFAVSPLLNDDKRWLFISNALGVFKYEVGQYGIGNAEYVWSYAINTGNPNFPQSSFTQDVTEMDLAVLNNGNVRVAATGKVSNLFCTSGPLSGCVELDGWYQVSVFDINPQGDVVNFGNLALPYFDPNNPSLASSYTRPNGTGYDYPHITGLELLRNDRIIINQDGVKHDGTGPIPNLIIYEITTSFPAGFTVGIHDFNIINSLFYPEFRHSHINTGVDGNLYLANDTHLGQYNPITNNFNTTFLSINYPSIFNGYNAQVQGIIESTPTHILPNQIKNENYTSPYTSTCCVDENQVFKTYTATLAGDTWSAFSNPFINPNQPGVFPNEIVITDELYFAPGSITTLNNFTILFEAGAKMTIARGAKVILNNSTLTTRACAEDLWEGVIVYGNPAISHAFPTNHGQLILNSSSEISNAVRGVRAFGTIDVADPITGEISMQPDFSNSGGIVQVSNSLFKNNKKDVEFYPYNFRNISYFNNTSFITDALLIDGSSPDTHLSLFGVRTIKVRGCTFENSTSGIYLNENLLGFGITAYESSFSVEAFNGNIRTSFDKLFYGIYASNANPLATSSVIDADFSDCFNGLYFNNVDYSIIERCQFDVNNPFQSINVPYGVYLQNSTGYKVANNDFITQTTNGDTRGILINNSNENGTSWDANAIFNNKFTGLNHASWAFNSNVGEFSLLGNTSIITGSGLLFKCNVYDLSIESDIMITRGGIRTHQGSCSTPTSGANNYFTPNYTPLIGDFWNNNNLPTLYTNQYFANPYNGVIGTTLIDEYNPVNTTNLNCNTPLDINKACKEDYPKSISRLLALSDSVKTAGQAKDNFYTALDSYVNNQWSLYQSGQLSVGNLKNNLLTKSPYLPTHILEAIIQSNMAPGNKKQLLLDNSPLPQNVVLLVQQSNLPNGIKNQILNGQNGGTNPRILVNAETEDLLAESKLTMNEAVRYYLHDTTVVNGLDSAIVLLKMRSEIIYRKQLADAYIENKQFFQAQNLIDSLKLVDNGAHLEFAKMRELLIAFEQCQEKGFRIMHDSTQRVQLESIKTNDNIRRECMSAQVIYDMVNKTKFDEEIPFIIVPKSYTPTPQNLTSASQMASIYVYPNPANDYLTVELMDETENAVITIYSILGSVMKTIRVNQSIQQIDVSDLELGIYLVTSTLSDGSISTERIVIER